MTTVLNIKPLNTSPILDEATWRAYMRHARGTGVIPEDPNDPEVLNGFEVYADSTGMQVKIKSGTAWIRGTYFPNPAEVIEAIGASHPTLHRIDRVALKFDMVNHEGTITVVPGTEAASPVAPTLTNTTSIYYLKLAQVLVTAAVTTIAANKVTDEREYSDAPQTVTIATGATPTPNCNVVKQFNITALAENCVFGAPTGTPTSGQKLIYRIKPDATPRTMAWNVIFIARCATPPIITIANKYIYVGYLYNEVAVGWDCMCVIPEL